MSQIDTLPKLRDVIAKNGLSARKSFGQNFLLDLNLTAKIARQAGSIEGYDILEIGPGPGGLTRGLLAEGARFVLAIEKDPRCLPALKQIEEAYPERCRIQEGDALEIDPIEYLNAPIKIVANLPYNIGTELLIRWLKTPQWPPFWSSLTLMFQREVAERIVAQPGSRAYGRLALLAQWRSDPQIVMSLPPHAFAPPPKVSSSVVHFTALPEPRFAANAAVLERVVAMAFNQRRKMLRTALKGLGPNIQTHILSAGLKPTDRAEQISLEGFCSLARELTPN